MQLNNFLQINDWEIKKFLKIVLTVQLAVLGAIGLDVIGLRVLGIRQFIGFIYLTFIPGIVILRVLRLHKLSNIETLLYSTGLSIAFLMFTGLFMNTFYPLLGISEPLSLVPSIITINVIVSILCVLSYVIDRNFSNPSYINFREVLSPPALSLSLLPFLAIFGTYLVNFRHTNILLMLLIVIIVFIATLVTFNKFIPQKFYALAIFCITIALLFHRTLISLYVPGRDIAGHLYLAELVKANSHWNSTNPPIMPNAMLSVTILPTLYSNILNMSITWIYKIIYPILLSLVPVALYQVFQDQTNKRIAFFSAYYFTLFPTFFITLTHTATQLIAELFFALLALLMVNKKMNASRKIVLCTIFSISMITSHYGLSYIYMLYLLFIFFSLYLIKNNIKITKTYIILYFTLTLLWYMYTSNAVTFNTIVRIGNHIYNSIATSFFAVEARDPTLWHFLGERAPSLWREIGYRIVQVTQFFILVGFLESLREKRMNFNREYIIHTFISFLLLFLVIILPFFATNISTSRIYQITLFYLSPFCIIGGIIFFSKLINLLRKLFATDFSFVMNPLLQEQALRFLVLTVLVPYTLFNTGFVFEVVGDKPFSISLSMERMKNSNDKDVIEYLNHEIIRDQEVCSAKWLSKYRNKNIKIYADPVCGSGVLTGYGKMFEDIRDINELSRDSKGGYIYLRYMNVKNGLMLKYPQPFRSGIYVIYNTSELFPLFRVKEKIYTNGGSEIYI